MTITCLVPVDYTLIESYGKIHTDRTLEDVIRQALIFALDNKEFWVGKPAHPVELPDF